jgi:tetratricopeptide (TPR) repeat protein
MLLMVLLAAVIVNAETVEEYIAAGDAAHDVFDHETALKNYKAAFTADAQNCDAAWKVSRALANIGDERTDQDERTKFFNQAEEYAKTAIELCPDSDMAHLSMSIAVGRVALMAGKKEQVQLSQVVKDEAEKAIELNPNNDTAHHVYARWHRKVATLSGVAKTFAKVLYGGLPDASLDKAVEHFQKAIALKPDYNNHYLELGITYEMMKEWSKANDAYKKAMAVEAKGSMEKKYKAEAAERQKNVAQKI